MDYHPNKASSYEVGALMKGFNKGCIIDNYDCSDQYFKDLVKVCKE